MEQEFVYRLLDGFAPFLMIGLVTLLALKGVSVFADIRFKNKLAEKGIDTSGAKYLIEREAKLRALSNLKWAIIFLSIGLTLVAAYLLNLDFLSPLLIGILLISVGVSLAGYFLLLQTGMFSVLNKRNNEDFDA